jgi:phosphate transport system substrate-binding protein
MLTQFPLRLFTSAVALAALQSLSASGFAAEAEKLTGAGSTAAAPVYQAWAGEYSQTHNVILDYQGIGSSAGLQKIRAHEVAFGASDVAPAEADLAKDGLVLIPMFITGAVPVVNLPGLPKATLRLDADTLAGIYLGDIKVWNAPEIQALNPGVHLPALPIKPIARSDGSGTTYYFLDYLTQASGNFKKVIAAPSTSAKWPANVLGAKGSDGVAAAVTSTPGSIGYIDFNYVASKNLAPVRLKDALGEFVDAKPESFSSALRASGWYLRGDFHSSLANLPAKDAWPITMGTFVVMQKTPDNAAEAQRSIQFFLWALLNGDAVVNTMSFVHLPDKVQALAYKNMSAITTKSGEPIGLNAIASAVKPTN